MKPGKVSWTTFRRSVLKKINRKVMIPLAEGSVLSCQVSLYGNQKDLGVFALARAINELASQGAKIMGISIQVLLPCSSSEADLAALMEELAAAAEKQDVQICGAEAETAPVLSAPMIHVTALGRQFAGESLDIGGREAVLLIGWIGAEGTLRIKAEKEEELSKRFCPSFLAQIDSLKEGLFAAKAIETVRQGGASLICPVTDGGIFAALWDLSEQAGRGFCVDLKKMSVRQETIEVCEYFHLNPYQLASGGAVLATVPAGEELAEGLRRKGIPAVTLGYLCEGTEKVICRGEERRYLDRPAPDELMKILERA